MSASNRCRRTITAWLGMASQAQRSDGDLRLAPGNPFLFDFQGFWPDELTTHSETIAVRHGQSASRKTECVCHADSEGVAA